MAIYYKFKSARDYDTVAMDGPFISVGILKDKIFESKHLGSGKDLDIVVSNAQTNEEYLDEAMLIPKNTSVLIRRVPGRPRITVITAQEPRNETKVEAVQADISNYPNTDPSVLKDPEEVWDEFGNDLYSIPDTQDVQHSIPRPDLAPTDEKVDEESKIQALIDTPALDWQRQGPDGFGAGRGYGRGMAGRMGGRGFGMERKTPPPGYVCHRCSVAGHFIQHCPTNGDPTYDVKRVKPPTGIPKSMLMATPDGSYSLPSGAVAVLKPNEDAFEKEMEGLPSTTRTVGELPPELKCPLCKEVMRDAALTSKCCFQSFCDKCIRDHIIAKSRCVCGATDVLADDLLPNKTLRDTINRILEAGNESTENAGSVGHIPDLESARCPPPKVISPTTSVASKGGKQSALSNNNNEVSNVKPPMEIAEITSVPRASAEIIVEKPADACESTQGSVAVKEATVSKLNTQAPKEEAQVQQQAPPGEQGKKKKKKTRVPGTDMQWNPVPDLAGPDYMMQMGPGPQFFNGMQPGFNNVQPGFNGVQPGFNGFHPGGFNGFGGPFPGPMPPPFMGYGLNPMDMAFGGGMNMMHPDPFVAQGFGFPNIPPPHRDLAELGNRMNLQRAMMGRDEAEARKAEMLRKRENERRTEGGKMYRDGESSRVMMNNGGGASASASSINPNKSRQGPPQSTNDYDRRRRSERLSPEHQPPRQISSPSRDSKRKSERHSNERGDRQRDRERSRHQDIEREHDRTRDHRRDEERSREHRHHRGDSERNQHHHRKRSEPPPLEPTKSEMENNNHKSSVFARISFPEEESSSKRRKVSSSASVSVTDPPALSVAAAAGSSVHRHSRREMEVGDYESSDEDRHFKRKPSRYERSPPVVVNDANDDKHRYSKRGKGDRSRS